MKKLNEDIAITDPALAQQYANGKQQLVNKDSQINALNKQILKLQADKIQIQKAIEQIEQKSAQEPNTNTQNSNQNSNNQAKPNPDLAKAQQALAAQVLMNSPTSEALQIYHANLSSKLISLQESLDELNESSHLDPKIMRIQSEIDKIKIELEYLNESDSNPFSPDIFYNVSEAYTDPDDQEYILYVEIEDRGNKFLAKIFKRSKDSKWFGRVIYGTSRTFENMTYDANYEEDDILNFLMNTYDNVRFLSKDEFDNYTEKDIYDNKD